jgi:hypothetical protein
MCKDAATTSPGHGKHNERTLWSCSCGIPLCFHPERPCFVTHLLQVHHVYNPFKK